MAKAKTTKANAKTTSAKTRRTKKEDAPVEVVQEKKPEVKDLKALAPVEEAPKVFESLCGLPFDPSAKASCATMCKGDSPEAYAACLANFETLGSKKTQKATAKKKATRGRTLWGHLKGCQGGLVDEILTEVPGPHSLVAIMEYTGGTQIRITGHMRHLVQNRGVKLRVTEDNLYFVEGYNDDGLTGVLTDTRKRFAEDGTQIANVKVKKATAKKATAKAA